MKLRRNERQAQQGSIIVTTAIALSLIVILLVGSELGYLFFLKRELQKTADLAALAGATSVTTTDCSVGRTAALANANTASTGNMPPGLAPLAAGEVVCGRWTSAGTATNPASRFTAATSNLNAVQVQFSRTPTSLLEFFTGNRTITVHAVAAKALPAAQLSIQSTLLSVDSTQSPILNAVFGNLLGGSVNIAAASWDGLAKSNVSLLTYLDKLAVRLNVAAGDYDSVLKTTATTGQLLQAAVDALTKDGSVSGAITALNGLVSAAASVPGTGLQIGQLLGIQTATSAAALNTTLQALQLAEGIVQLANGSNAAATAIAVTVPGVASVSAQVKVIEKPQFSAIGNPNLISPSLGTSDPNKIYVRTAQVRSLISINLGSQTSTSSALQTVLDDVTSAVSPLVNFLSTVSNATLPSLVSGLLSAILPCAPCASSRVLYAQVLNSKIDVSVDAANGSAYVTNHACTDDTTKSLTAQATTSIANVRVGSISNAFSSSQPISVAPISVAEIGYRETRYESCLLPLLSVITCSNQTWKNAAGTFVSDKSSGAKTAIAGLGLKLDSPVGSTTPAPLIFSAPIAANLPEINAAAYSGSGADPSYKAISSQSLVSSLSSTLGGVSLTAYSGQGSGVLGIVLNGTVSLINALLSTLRGTITSLLSPLLDPVTNTLLKTLALDLAKTEVGARMTCSKGAELVY